LLTTAASVVNDSSLLSGFVKPIIDASNLLVVAQERIPDLKNLSSRVNT
jgi:hypothetical protein